MEHHINIFWNRHIVHHSSEEFNLACALRQSISEIFSYTTLFLVPLVLLGVPAEVYAITAPIHLFTQFWYHTRLIDKMLIITLALAMYLFNRLPLHYKYLTLLFN